MGCCINPINIIGNNNNRNNKNYQINIETLQNKEFSNLISKKESNITREKEKSSNSDIIKSSINEYEIQLNEISVSQISNNKNLNNLQKSKLETVRESIDEFSFRKVNSNHSKHSSTTQKINSEKCEDNYTKKTNQMIKLVKRKQQQ